MLSYVRRAMNNEGFSNYEIRKYSADAMSSNYNHLLKISLEKIAECNGEVSEAVGLE